MLRRIVFLGLLGSVLLAGQATAQIIVPGLPLGPKAKMPALPNIEGITPDLQQQFQQIFQQAALAQRRPGKGDGSILWGGLRLNRADADLQAQLGLGKDEGLVVVSVDPNSAADRVGLKASDVLLKINGQAVPNDVEGFTKLIKEQKVAEAADIVVVRKGKEETIKAAKMPAVVQSNPLAGQPGAAGRLGAGGILAQRIQINPRPNPLQPGAITKLYIERNVNGAKFVQKQDGDEFSGEFSKDDLKITVAGKIENGVRAAKEISITQGKETKKYASLKEVPAAYHVMVRQLMQSPVSSQMMLPTIPNLQNFPGLPVIPGIDD